MKLRSFQNYLRQENINLTFLISPDSDLTYFTQIPLTYAHLLITSKDACLYTTKLDCIPKLKKIDVAELKKDWHKEFNKKVKKVGINEEKITYQQYQKLKKLFPKAKFVDVSSKLKELRKQKTEAEIKRISTASKITTAAFQTFIDNYSPKRFKTELEVAFFLEKQIRQQRAELAFPTIVASAEHSAIPHSVTSKAKLKTGFLQFDFGAKYQNYCSDMSRVLFLGKISPEQREHYNLLLKVQEETIRQIKKGSKFAELDIFTRKNLGKFSSYFVHSLGHGLGIDIHESPALISESKDRIENKQVFTIEPGIYFPKKYGLRIEDTILFDQKTKILTSAPKDLIVLK